MKEMDLSQERRQRKRVTRIGMIAGFALLGTCAVLVFKGDSIDQLARMIFIMIFGSSLFLGVGIGYQARLKTELRLRLSKKEVPIDELRKSVGGKQEKKSALTTDDVYGEGNPSL